MSYYFAVVEENLEGYKVNELFSLFLGMCSRCGHLINVMTAWLMEVSTSWGVHI